MIFFDIAIDVIFSLNYIHHIDEITNQNMFILSAF